MQARRSVISLAALTTCLRQSNTENNLVEHPSNGVDLPVHVAPDEQPQDDIAVALAALSRLASKGSLTVLDGFAKPLTLLHPVPTRGKY
jgi:hypothetical protein